MHRDTLHIVHRDTLRELRTVHDSVFSPRQRLFWGRYACERAHPRPLARSPRHGLAFACGHGSRGFAPRRHAQREDDDAPRLPLAAVVADRLPCRVRPDRLRAETQNVDENAPPLVYWAAGLTFFVRSRKWFPNTSKTRPRCAEKRPDLTVAGFLLHIG